MYFPTGCEWSLDYDVSCRKNKVSVMQAYRPVNDHLVTICCYGKQIFPNHLVFALFASILVRTRFEWKFVKPCPAAVRAIVRI